MEYKQKMAAMRKLEKNIPFSRKEIKDLPLGFSETAVMPTRNIGNPHKSKFIPPPKPKFERHGTKD
jgi:hypothetical protein